MPTKEELSEKINEILGLEDTIDFSKMTKEDLESLLKVVEEPANLIRMGWKNAREKVKKEVLEEILGRPILEEILSKTGEEGEGDKGPLGFGVLPKLRGILKGTLAEGEAEKSKE